MLKSEAGPSGAAYRYLQVTCSSHSGFDNKPVERKLSPAPQSKAKRSTARALLGRKSLVSTPVQGLSAFTVNLYYELSTNKGERMPLSAPAPSACRSARTRQAMRTCRAVSRAPSVDADDLHTARGQLPFAHLRRRNLATWGLWRPLRNHKSLPSPPKQFSPAAEHLADVLVLVLGRVDGLAIMVLDLANAELDQSLPTGHARHAGGQGCATHRQWREIPAHAAARGRCRRSRAVVSFGCICVSQREQKEHHSLRNTGLVSRSSKTLV